MKFRIWFLIVATLMAPLTLSATRYGPDQIWKCPKCTELFREHQLSSGNTFHAVWWTDGKMEAPMLPDQPRLVRCRKCRTPFWVADAQIVAEDYRINRDSEWKNVQDPESANEAEFLAAAAAVTADPKREIYLRTRAWWLHNDPGRKGTPDPAGWTAEHRQNLVRLEQLLDPKTPDQRLLQAEIERELGNFEASLKILAEDFSDKYAATVSLLRELATARKPEVARFP